MLISTRTACSAPFSGNSIILPAEKIFRRQLSQYAGGLGLIATPLAFSGRSVNASNEKNVVCVGVILTNRKSVAGERCHNNRAGHAVTIHIS